MTQSFVLAVAIFVVAYVLIVSEKVHRSVAAMGGATLLLLTGVLDQEQALHGVDFNTLGLLIGMMLLVSVARHSGMFQYVALWTCRAGKGRPIPIFLLIGLVTAVFSALLDNVTTVLLMTPVLIVVTNNLGVAPMPWLVATILLSNIGGMGTLVGDPPNIMIGSAAGLSFNQFMVALGPPAAIIGFVTSLLTLALYRDALVTTPEASARVMSFDPAASIEDPALLKRSLFVLAVVLVGFMTHGVTGLEGATIALGGAILLLALDGRDPEHALRDVEWNTILFFTGLFILVGGLESVGAIDAMAKGLLEATGGDRTTTAIAVLWGSAFCSAIVDNIPFVATMIPLVKDIATQTGMDVEVLWWSLALGADLGGNATLVGASANVVVAGLADKAGHPIGFMAFLKVALPMTVVAVALAHAWLWWALL